jgi:glyoxalase family protein
MQLGGLHHVTAVTGDAPANVAFYTQVLGLRLVKRTVNQDDVSAYHLFYGDEIGSPGTEVTFFDWPNIGPYVAGVGEVSTIKLRVPGSAALDWWSRRFDERGIAYHGLNLGPGRPAITLVDPEGQRLQLVDDGGAPGGIPWSGSPVPPEQAIRGMYAVSLTVDNLGPTARVLTEVMGFRRGKDYSSAGNDARQVAVFEIGPGGPGAEIHVEERPEMPRARVGIGGVHHIAFRTPNDEEHRQWRDRIAAARISVTPPIDRYYFRSIYFREPGGVLFEIATDGPGFATDEDAAHLGERLALPPFLEPHRNEIEAGLRPLEPLRLSTE